MRDDCCAKFSLLAGTLLLAFFVTGCASKQVVKEKELTSSGQTSYQATTVNDKLRYELRRVFDGTNIEGVGIFENANEGLARRTAIQLAVADVASQVQTLVRTETVIYNNQDVRDVVENRVHALVNNYRIDFSGYDPGTNKYRARVSVNGEQLRREIEKRIIR
jgi:hypothetical protein